MRRLTMVALLVCAGLGGALTTSAQPFVTLLSFGNGPVNPRANLTPGPDGNYYGTASAGGQYGGGAVFRVSTNGNLITLASFGSFLKDATLPWAGLTLGADGNFYGTTIAGGTNTMSGTNNSGTIFRVTTNGTLTTVVSFTGLNGSYPECKLTIGPNGSFYGTTAYGGASNAGTVFQATTNGVLTMLASFSGTNGAMPQAGLTLGLDGNFYGTTTYGGISNVGTIFQVTPGGSLKTLVHFNTTNGSLPYGQLTLGSDGELYGTTSYGGVNSGPFQITSNSSVGFSGTVFRVTTNGTLTTLAHLSMYEDYGGIYPGLEVVGRNPYGQLVQGPDGSFYGTTSGGGTNGSGTIFKVSTNGTLDQLASLPNLQYQFLTNFLGFVYVNYTTNNYATSSLTLLLNATVKKVYDFPPLVNTTNATGAESRSGLTLGPGGNFYAAVYKGGTSGYGTVIRVATNGTVTPLASFSGNTGSGIHAGLTLGPDGSLYGAAQSGGVNNMGTLFKWSPGGSLATLHSFDYRPDGANPNARLTVGPDGNLYGTAINGGTNLLQVGPNSYNAVSDGTVFRLGTNGVFTPLVYFNATNGANPYGPLTLLGDGKFYGTTAYGGTSNLGTVFQVTTDGTLTVLGNFTGTNGSRPYGKLTAGPNGNLYGTTGFGGTNTYGTVFEVTTQGMINTIFHFAGTNGYDPQSGLLWNSDGYFYGTTASGGKKVLGTIFKLTPGGALTTLVNFGQTNGSSPEGDLIKGPDGNIYGATPQGGTGFNGTVFRLDANGNMTSLFSFPSTSLNASFSSGFHPYSGLLLVTNGNFIHLYGTAYGGGNDGGGTIFQVNSITYYTVTENTSTLLNPLTNDVLWTIGGSLTLVGTSTTNGTATINGTKILVLPGTNFTGSATLAYTFTDGIQTNTSLITLLVTNIPPAANPDFYTVAENSSANVLSPLVNDVPLTSGGVLTLVRVSATNGTAVISGTNVLFTPALDFVGTATIGYTITDGIGGTNSSLITVTVANVSADLSLTAKAAPEPVGVSSNLVYSITVSNAGPATATGVVVSNPVPANATFVSATGGATPAGGVLLLNLGSLAAGATGSFQVTVQPATPGKLTNLFQVFGDQPDPLPTNNIATVVSTITNSIITTFSTTTAEYDTILTTNLNLRATNFSTELIAKLPDGTIVFDQTFNVPFADAAVQTAIGQAATNLANNGSTSYIGPGQTSFSQTPTNVVSSLVTNSITTNVTFNTTTYIGPLTISTGNLGVYQRFIASGAYTGPTGGNPQPLVITTGTEDIDTFTTNALIFLRTQTVTSNFLNTAVYTMTGVVAQVDVALTLTASPNPVSVGSPLTYSLTVTNKSSATATSVVVSNTLPGNVTFNSALPSQGSATNQSGIVTYSVGSLPNGSAATLAIVVIPNAAGLLTNIAAAASTQTDSQPANNRATNITTAVNQAITNLLLTVLSGVTLNPLTGLFEQRVQVSNGGPATPSSVRVIVSGLAANATLYNATGTTNGKPYVQSTSPLGIGSNIVFLLEYYVPTRVAPANLTFTVEAGAAVIPPVISGTILNIDRTIVRQDGSVAVEFSTIPGQIYAVQYSSNMATWRTAVPAITPSTSRVQWIDAGPPKTDSNPAGQPARYYRVLLLPAH